MNNSIGQQGTQHWQARALVLLAALGLATWGAVLITSFPQVAHAATTIFFDDFGIGSTLNDIPDWDEDGSNDSSVRQVAQEPAVSGEDTASPDGGRFAKIGRTGVTNDGWICREFDATGFTDLELSYYWRGDADAESGGSGGPDLGVVEYKDGNGSCEDTGWAPLQSHGLHIDSSWSTQSAFALSNVLDDGVFRLRFRTDTTANDEYFRVDAVSLTGDSTTATLTLEKTVVTDNGGTAVDTDWTLSATNGGDTTISGVEGDPEITDAEVPVDTYDLSESGGPSGYSASDWVCTEGVMVDGDTVTLSDGDDAVCTITNDDQPGTLIVVKELPNDDGGTATPDEFSFQVNGGGSTAFEEDGQNNITVDAGTYTVVEDGVPLAGYTTEYDNCEDVLVGNGETQTCTITNNDIASSLTVIKVIENDGPTRPGTKVIADFDLFVNFDEVVSGILNFFSAGSYTVSEQNADGYNATFSGHCASDGSITLALGEDYTCTITNNDKAPGTLHVVKHVINDEPDGFEGTAEEGDFTITVSGGNPDPASFSGSELGVPVIIDAGASYSVSETAGPSGYSVSYSPEGCDSGVMPEGGEATCTITNDDLPPTQGSLTVLKSVVSDNGGSASASAWTLLVTDSEDTTTAVENGEANLLDPGTYTLDETGGVDGYEQTGISCTDNGSPAGGSPITVVEGHSYVCTIVNDDTAPSLTVVKEVLNDNGGSAEASEWTVGAIGPTSISGEGSASSDGTFQAGTYELTETGGPSSGYTADDWSCTNGVAVANESGENEITLGIGEETTCTIVNDDEPATLIVIKHVINDNGGEAIAEDFTIYVEGGDASPSEFSGDEEGVEVTLDAGSYSVSEDGPDGYGLTASEECSGTIENGETKTCTLTNDDGKATLTIEKYAEGADGTFVFTVTDQEDVEITTSEGDGSADLALDAGIYDVIELVPAGWTLVFSYCEYDEEETGEQIENGHTVFLDVGDHVTCYFEDTATGADVSVEKSVDDDTPDAGQTIVYTITVSNAGPADAENVTVVDFLPSGVSYVSDDGEGDYSSETGAWNVGGLANGESRTLTITVTVDNETEGQVIENGATVSVSDEEVSDYDESNNEGATSITVNTPEPETPALTPPPGGGGGGGIPSLFGIVNGGGGQVLGASTGQVLGESCGLYLGQYLRRGNPKNSADQVTKLQEFLVENGFGVFSPTGFFGPLTEGAVKAFQNQYASSILAPWGLSTPTGLAYLTTIRQLNLLECPDLSIVVPELVPWSQNPNVQ